MQDTWHDIDADSTGGDSDLTDAAKSLRADSSSRRPGAQRQRGAWRVLGHPPMRLAVLMPHGREAAQSWESAGSGPVGPDTPPQGP